MQVSGMLLEFTSELSYTASLLLGNSKECGFLLKKNHLDIPQTCVPVQPHLNVDKRLQSNVNFFYLGVSPLHWCCRKFHK